MYTAKNIAHYILYRCVELNRPVTVAMLQNMLYDIQRDSLQILDKPMFNDIIEAWGLFPVIPRVYFAYVGAGASEIYEFKKPTTEFEVEDRDIIENVIESYKEANPWIFKQRHDSAYNRARDKGGRRPIVKWEDIKMFG